MPKIFNLKDIELGLCPSDCHLIETRECEETGICEYLDFIEEDEKFEEYLRGHEDI